LDWGLLNKTKNISRQDESNIKVAWNIWFGAWWCVFWNIR
jgi:hypothetical protein